MSRMSAPAVILWETGTEKPAHPRKWDLYSFSVRLKSPSNCASPDPSTTTCTPAPARAGTAPSTTSGDFW